MNILGLLLKNVVKGAVHASIAKSVPVGHQFTIKGVLPNVKALGRKFRLYLVAEVAE